MFANPVSQTINHPKLYFMKQPSKRILVINPFGIGDVLFTTPLIHTIKQSFPQSFIAYICNYRTESILKENPYIDKIIPFSRGDIKKIAKKSKIEALKKSFSLIRWVKKTKFDLLFDFSLEYRYNMVARFLGIPQRIGFNYKNRGRFLTDKIDIDGYAGEHIVEYNLDLLKFLGMKKVATGRLELFLSKEDKQWAENFLENNNLSKDDFVVGIIPGGGESWGRTAFYRLWAKEKFAQVADGLIKKYNAKIIILGSLQEKKICQDVANLMQKKPIIACGKTSVRQFAAILKKCKLAITNDGGPLHIVVSQDVKSISIFGPVDEKVYGPYPSSKRHIVLKKELSCRPCYKKFKMPECKDRKCLELITAEDVLEAAEKLLEV